MKLTLTFGMGGFQERFRLENDKWEGLADLAKRSLFIFMQAHKDFIAHEKELAESNAPERKT